MPLSDAVLQDIAARYSAAWSSGDPAAVASFYAPDGRITINRGGPIVGRTAVEEMARGFHGEFPGLTVACDEMRTAGDHAIFVWTLEGTHSGTGNRVKVKGWEEWELDGEGLVTASLGWFDAAEYERQIAEGV